MRTYGKNEGAGAANANANAKATKKASGAGLLPSDEFFCEIFINWCS